MMNDSLTIDDFNNMINLLKTDQTLRSLKEYALKNPDKKVDVVLPSKFIQSDKNKLKLELLKINKNFEFNDNILINDKILFVPREDFRTFGFEEYQPCSLNSYTRNTYD